jgi:hypothetical protein
MYAAAKTFLRSDSQFDNYVNYDTDFFGYEFKPFGTHNYLYGFSLKEIIAEQFEILNNPKHPDYEEKKQTGNDIVREYNSVGGTLLPGGTWYAQEDVGLKLTQTKYGMTGLLILACHPNANLNDQQRVQILVAFAAAMLTMLVAASLSAFIGAPLLLLAQLGVSGWKKTAWTWGVGTALTEAVSYVNKNDKDTRRLAGWSIITYGIFGHFFMEIYKRPRLLKIMNLFKYPQFLTLAGGALGTFNTIYSLVTDPGYPNGKHAGTGHAFHHLGILYGAWLNR